MPLVTTEAIVLHAFPYSESSKIVRLATRDHGVISAIAKGAHRSKNKFGAGLQVLSEGTVRIYFKQNRELQTLAEFELSIERQGLARELARFAAAAALAEIVMRCSPQEPQPEIYEILKQSLDWLVEAPTPDVPLVALVAMWNGVGALGFTPVLDACAVDGAALESKKGEFSVVEGGLLCGRCARSRETASLAPTDVEALRAFVAGVFPPRSLSAKHAAAHRRLCARFVRRHVAEGRDLKALDLWETLT